MITINVETDNLMSGFARIRVEGKYAAKKFWTALCKDSPMLAHCLSRRGTATIPSEFWNHIKTLPGFSGGPEYAPDALVLVTD